MANTEYSIPINYRALYEKFLRFLQALKYSLANVALVYHLSRSFLLEDDIQYMVSLESAFDDMSFQTLSKSIRKNIFYF